MSGLIPQVVVTDSLIDKMTRDEKFTSQFSILKNPPRKQSNCRPCARLKRTGQTVIDYNAVRIGLASLDKQSKIKLMSLLQTNKVKISYRQGHKVIHVVFGV